LNITFGEQGLKNSGIEYESNGYGNTLTRILISEEWQIQYGQDERWKIVRGLASLLDWEPSILMP